MSEQLRGPALATVAAALVCAGLAIVLALAIYAVWRVRSRATWFFGGLALIAGLLTRVAGLGYKVLKLHPHTQRFDAADPRVLAIAKEVSKAPVEPPAAPVASGSHAAPSSAVIVTDTEDWLQRVAACELSGPARQLASHTAFVSHANDMLTLALDPGFEYLRSERSLAALSEALAAQLGGAPKIVVQDGAPAADTLHRRKDRERDSRQSAAEQAFLNDPTVRRLVEQHGARVVPDSIRPVEEN